MSCIEPTETVMIFYCLFQQMLNILLNYFILILCKQYNSYYMFMDKRESRNEAKVSLNVIITRVISAILFRVVTITLDLKYIEYCF